MVFCPVSVSFAPPLFSSSFVYTPNHIHPPHYSIPTTYISALSSAPPSTPRPLLRPLLSSLLLFPQLVDKMCMVNAPSWMSYVLGFFRKILPKRNMDKIALFTNQKKFWSSEWAQSTFARDEVPEFVGGTLPDDKLSEKLKGTLLEGKGEEVMTTVVVPARSIREVVLDVPLKEATIVVTINLAGYGVEVSATHAHGGEGGECKGPPGKSTV